MTGDWGLRDAARTIPWAGAPLDLDAYTSAQHFVVSTRSEPSGWVDEVLGRGGGPVRWFSQWATFAPTPLALEATDLIMGLPETDGRGLCKTNGSGDNRLPGNRPACLPQHRYGVARASGWSSGTEPGCAASCERSLI